MKKFKNKKTNEILIVKTPNLITKYEKDPLYVEIKTEFSKIKEETKEIKENK